MVLVLPQFKLDLIRQATLNDDNLTVLKRVILDGWPDEKELMQFHNVPVRPWSKVAIDVFTVLGRGLSCYCRFFTSDFWELDELTSTNTSNIILACKSHFARYGGPRTNL